MFKDVSKSNQQTSMLCEDAKSTLMFNYKQHEKYHAGWHLSMIYYSNPSYLILIDFQQILDFFGI